MTTGTEQFNATSDEHRHLTRHLRLTDGETIRVRQVGNTWRAYWTRLVSGHERGHIGGATVRQERLPVRHGITGGILTGRTVEDLVTQIEALHATSDLDVPMYPEPRA